MQWLVANWKMHGDKSKLAHYFAQLKPGAVSLACELIVCPPSVYLDWAAQQLQDSPIALGAQDAHWQPAGPHTGDVAVNMLAEVGCTYVIVGHSERRQGHHESSDIVAKKARRAYDSGLRPIVCIGESDDKLFESQLSDQLQALIPELAQLSWTQPLLLAYEPVWAIGTGRVATVAHIERVLALMTAHLRQHAPTLADAKVLYGGSLKPANAGEILTMPGLAGGLVGSAALDAASFLEIGRQMSPKVV